jgi:hypothetical protein
MKEEVVDGADAEPRVQPRADGADALEGLDGGGERDARRRGTSGPLALWERAGTSGPLSLWERVGVRGTHDPRTLR